MQATRHSTVRLALGSVLIGTIPVATTAVAQAVQQVVADPGAPAAQRPTMTESLNKTPVQNIVAPNASGLSHNKLQQFNVDQRNLIINNSRVNAVSSIGGAVVANPNLAGGEARIILNEVTSGSRSVLQGNQELLGGRAAYILANPNGITCDGCGFLNFPRVTMTTGVPVIDGDVLRGLRVNGGDVRIGAAGLNTQGLDAFDILSRALVVEGVLKAPELRVVAGRNEVAYDSLVATPLTPDGSAAPSWAIDSSVLGGMYAGRISLVSTEAGVGVRLQGEVAASVDDVTLNAAGRIQLKGAMTAQRDVRIASSAAATGAGPEVEFDGARVYAGQDAWVQGGDLLLRGGRLGAGRDLSVRAASLQDTGLAPAVGEDAKAQRLRDAGRNLSVNVDGAATLNGSAWQAGQQMSWLADSLTLSDAAVQSGGNASLSLRTLTLDAASFAAGAKGLRSGGVLDLQVTQALDNAGLIGGDAGLNLRAGSLTNRSGALIQSGAAQAADASITVTGALTQAGTIGSTGDLTVTAQSLNSQAGEISAQDELTLAVSGTWTNAQNAKAQAKVLNATAGNLNNAGVVYAQQALTLIATTLNNQATGQVTSGGNATVRQGANGGTLTNAGQIGAQGALNLSHATIDNQTSGRLIGATGLNATVNQLTNAGTIVSDGAATFNSASARGAQFNNTGTVDAVSLNGWFNGVLNQGILFGLDGLNLTAATLRNEHTIQSGGAMTLDALTLQNVSSATRTANITAQGNLGIIGNQTLLNQATAEQRAIIASTGGLLSIDSRGGSAADQSVHNLGGLLFGKTGLTLYVSREFLNRNQGDRRGVVFADAGQMWIGGADRAAIDATGQDIVVRNEQSDIENRLGSVSIYADVFENSPGAYTPVKTTVTYTRTSGTFDYDGTLDGTGDLISVYGGCATFEDHFDKDRRGHRCAKSVTVTQEQLVGGSAPRSAVMAGTDLNLYVGKSALNHVSLMSAGGNLTISGSAGATFENRAVTLLYQEQATVYRYEDGGYTLNPAGDCYQDGKYIKCFFLSGDVFPNRLKRFANISLQTAPFVRTVGVSSTVEAGGKLTISVSKLTNANSGTENENAPPTGQPTGASGGAVNNPNASTTVSGQTLNPSTLQGLGNLQNSPFFLPSKNPSSGFLFETDPTLISLAGLYGSDLFLKALGLDPVKYLRVGDPYFEQQLLRQQLLSQAGQRFIADGLVSENDQFKYLMENGVASASDLQLRVGVALTAEQVASLQKDIVWMVETEVQGKKVLVPQLYLADSTRAWLASGAKLTGRDIEATAAGDMLNSGAIVARESIKLDAGGTFTNRLGDIAAGGSLDVKAKGDVLNQSGTISGQDVTVRSTEGSVVNETLTKDITVHGEVGSGTNTVVGATAGITATGKLAIDAKQDIVSKGGELNAGQDATLTAGNDIVLTSIEKKSYTGTRDVTYADGYRTESIQTEQKTEQVGSGLNVGGNLDAKAGRDIKLEASEANVGGNASLDAKRDITITAKGETSNATSDTSTTSWNSSASEKTTIEQTTGKAAGLNVGGNLAIQSGRDTNIVGSDVSVGGDLDVKGVGGNLNITTFEETVKVTSVTEKSSIFGGEAKAKANDSIAQSEASATGTLFSNSKETIEIDSMTNRGSTLSVGGNLNADKGAIKGDVNIKGSDVATGGNLNLNADGNINVLAADDRTTVKQSSESNSFGITASASIDGAGAALEYQRNESSGSATQTTAKVSSLSAGKDININAGKDFTEQGTKVQAGGNIAVEAESIKSLAAKDSYVESGDSLSVSVSAGVKAETGLGAVVSSFVSKGNKAEFDMAAASQSLSGLDVPDAGSVKGELSVSVTKTTTTGSGTDAKASSFSSGGNTSFKARSGDATFEGTDVTAGGDISVAADKGNVRILAADSSSRSSTDTTNAKVTVGMSADGTFSASGSGGESSQTASSTSQKAASFKSGGNVSVTAQKDVELVGTNIEAVGNADITATTGKIDFKAARDTTSATSDEMSANASFSANVTGKEGSVGGGYSEKQSSESTSTGKAGSIKAGNVNLKSKGDITLEGTNITAKDSATIDTQGKVDFQAVANTSTKTTTGMSAQVDIEAGAKSAGVSASGGQTDEFESSTTRTAGSLNAGNLTIKAGTGIRLEGTKVDVKQDANIDAGQGKLVLESAVSESTKRVNNTDVAVGLKADAKAGSGQGSVKVKGAYEDTQKTTQDNATLNIGGKADLKAAQGIDIKGKDVGAGITSVVTAGSLDTHGAAVTTENRAEVNQSTRRDVDVSVGVIVPSKKARNEVADTVRKVKESDTANTIRNKAESASTALSNAGSTVSTKLKNAAGDVATAFKNVGKDDATRQANNDANDAAKLQRDTDLNQTRLAKLDAATDKKLANNLAQADLRQTKKAAAIDADQAKADQRARYEQQKADTAATQQRDQAIKKLDPTLDAKTREQEVAKINADFETKKADNARAFEDKKLANANEALTQKSNLAETTATRKEAAENRRAESMKRHQDEAAPTQQALAQRGGDDGSQAKADQQLSKQSAEAHQQAQVAQVKADATKAKADNDATRDKLKADHQAQRDADTAINQARKDQAEADRKVDADKTLTDAQREAKKEANQKAADDKVKQAETKRDDQLKSNEETLNQALADHSKAREDARVKAEADERKAVAEAELATRKTVKDDNVRQVEQGKQAKIDQIKKDGDTKVADLGKTRDTAIDKAQKDHDTAIKAADQQKADALKRKDAEVQRAKEAYAKDKALTEKNTKDQLKQAKADKDKAVADAKLAAQKSGDKDSVRKVEQSEQAKIDQIKKDGDTKLADLSKTRDSAIEGARKDLDTAVKSTEQQKADALKRKEAETKRANEAHEKATAEAKKDLDDKVKQAEADKAKAVDTAQQAMVKKLDEAQKKREEALAVQDKAEAELSAALLKQNQQRTGDQGAEAQARDKADAVRKDTTLSEVDRAKKLQAEGVKAADAIRDERIQQANERNQLEAKRDEAAKAAELAGIDPRLDTAGRDAAKKAIDDKYQARADERDNRLKTEKDQAVAAATKAKAEATTQGERDTAIAQAKADADKRFEQDTKKADEQLKKDLAAVDKDTKRTDEQKKAEKARLQADADQAAKERTLQRDKAEADAVQQQDIKQAAARRDEQVKQAEKDRDDKLNAKPAPTEAEKKRILADFDKAKQNADKRKTAAEKDAAALQKERHAEIERSLKDAEVDANTALTDKEREQKKAEHAKAEALVKKEAEGLRAEADKLLKPLLTPQERLARDTAAAERNAPAAGSADDAADKVRNPDALSTRLRPLGTKAKRWKEVVTAFGLKVKTTPPPKEKPTETFALTTPQLLTLARDFQAGDQAMALRVLRDPDVQKGAVVQQAVQTLREEVREERLKEITAALKGGNELAVLTVADQRRYLVAQGKLKADEDLSPADVMARFKSTLDAEVAQVQPSTAQKAEILKAMSVDVPEGKTIDEVYGQVLQKSDAAVKRIVKDDMKLSPQRADDLAAKFAP